MLRTNKYGFPVFFSVESDPNLSNAGRPTIPPAPAELPPPSTTGPPAPTGVAALRGDTGTKKNGGIELDPDAESRRRKHATEAAATLREQAERTAHAESQRTGKTVEPAKTPTVDELLGESFTQEGALAIPTTAAARPGESTNGPQSAAFSRTRVIAEHMVSNVAVVPTVNAPGLGADTGIKYTADNVDARGGSGHDDGPDPADKVVTAANPNAVTGIAGIHSAERGDTPERNAERIADAQRAGAESPAKAEAIEQTKVEQDLARTGQGPDKTVPEPVDNGTAPETK